MFKKLQEDHNVWAVKNFGKQDVDDYALGMIEEIGELAHSVLKRKQGIRNNEDHDALIADAIGDITIYLVGFCNCYNIDMDEIYLNRDTVNHNNLNMINCITLMNMSISLLSGYLKTNISYKKFIIGILFERLVYLCTLENIDYEEIVQDVWHAVSKRDWVNNPNDTKVADTDDPRYQGFPI